MRALDRPPRLHRAIAGAGALLTGYIAGTRSPPLFLFAYPCSPGPLRCARARASPSGLADPSTDDMPDVDGTWGEIYARLHRMLREQAPAARACRTRCGASGRRARRCPTASSSSTPGTASNGWNPSAEGHFGITFKGTAGRRSPTSSAPGPSWATSTRSTTASRSCSRVPASRPRALRAARALRQPREAPAVARRDALGAARGRAARLRRQRLPRTAHAAHRDEGLPGDALRRPRDRREALPALARAHDRAGRAHAAPRRGSSRSRAWRTRAIPCARSPWTCRRSSSRCSPRPRASTGASTASLRKWSRCGCSPTARRSAAPSPTSSPTRSATPRPAATSSSPGATRTSPDASRARQRRGHRAGARSEAHRALLPRRPQPLALLGRHGAGLAIVKHVLQRHQGRLEIASGWARAAPSPACSGGARAPAQRRRRSDADPAPEGCEGRAGGLE